MSHRPRHLPSVCHVLSSLACATLLACTSGCYESRWSAAGDMANPDDGIAGRWQGTWKSDSNGHNGGLRCIISEVTPTSFKADFKATYGWIFSFSYVATMQITAGSSQPSTGPAYVYFKGEEDLGWLAGGLYQYDGKVSPTIFFCTYKTESDHGTFQMTRPGGAVTIVPDSRLQPATVAAGASDTP